LGVARTLVRRVRRDRGRPYHVLVGDRVRGMDHGGPGHRRRAHRPDHPRHRVATQRPLAGRRETLMVDDETGPSSWWLQRADPAPSGSPRQRRTVRRLPERAQRRTGFTARHPYPSRSLNFTRRWAGQLPRTMAATSVMEVSGSRPSMVIPCRPATFLHRGYQPAAATPAEPTSPARGAAQSGTPRRKGDILAR
jgi:hypothetical protein